MKRTRRHVIKFPIFGRFEVRVSFCADIRAEATRLQAETCGDEAALTVIDSGEAFAHIILTHTCTAENIAHESFHAIWALMKWAGAELEDEIVAYHLGHVVGLIHGWRKPVLVKASRKTLKEIGREVLKTTKEENRTAADGFYPGEAVQFYRDGWRFGHVVQKGVTAARKGMVQVAHPVTGEHWVKASDVRKLDSV